MDDKLNSELTPIGDTPVPPDSSESSELFPTQKGEPASAVKHRDAPEFRSDSKNYDEIDLSVIRSLNSSIKESISDRDEWGSANPALENFYDWFRRVLDDNVFENARSLLKDFHEGIHYQREKLVHPLFNSALQQRDKLQSIFDKLSEKISGFQLDSPNTFVKNPRDRELIFQIVDLTSKFKAEYDEQIIRAAKLLKIDLTRQKFDN